MKTVLYLLREYWKNAKGHRADALLVAFLFIVSLAIWTFEPMLFGKIINTLQYNSGKDAMDRIVFLTVVWAGMYVAFNLLFRTGEYLATALAYKVKAGFISRSYRRLARLSLAWHAEHHSGESINRVNKASETIYQLVGWQWQYFDVSVRVIGSFVALSIIDRNVAMLAAVVATAFFVLSSFMDRIIQRHMDRINRIQNRISAVLFDFIGNMHSIIILRLGARTAKDVEARVEEARRPTVLVWGLLSQGKWLFISLSFMLMEVGVIFYFIRSSLSYGGSVDLGSLSAIFLYLEKIGGSFYQLADIYQNLMQHRANLENARVIEEADDLVPPEGRGFKWKKIELKGIRFSHGERKAAVLAGVDLEFKRGDKIALMGESGAGKSTLMLLLRGLAREDGGDVLIDGKREKRGLGSLAPITTLMLQDPEVFEQTIRYNITMGLDYSEADIERALALSRFDQVLHKLPLGLETDIRERGVNLSGGERQRLVLARNILAACGSDIILMDESTSSVDGPNENLIYDGILMEFKDKTIIASVHKPAVAEKFKRIVRIESGRSSAERSKPKGKPPQR
ncbi:MAG: ABC transporter ATP-binding protein/permease [Rickettsiales bacterium]|jgi:ABC-type multidrug transport system fused ATPase/permease subunit|nr:ABC transporter ATP-binding protein/permease [Rickettsiales bacterium]